LKDIQSAGIYKERSGQDGFQGLMVRNFVTGDIAAAWIEQRCRSSAFRDIAWDKVLSVPRKTGT